MILVNQPLTEILKGDDLSTNSLNECINQSLTYLRRVPAQQTFYYGKQAYTASEMIASFQLFTTLLNRNLNYIRFISEIEKLFYIFKSSYNHDDQVLFTGYYEPNFEGNLTRTKYYNIPVYTLPDDLIVLNLGRFRQSLSNRTIVYRLRENKILPYYTREEIMRKGVLAGKRYEIAWMKDPVDLFFMQIQGSGILTLPDSRKVKLSYAGSNGRKYTSIGKILVESGKMELEAVSMGSIRKYLTEHPEERDRLLFHNKSYTFFRLSEEYAPPKGNINVPLTKHRSIATDTNIFPKASLAYIKSEIPVFRESWDRHKMEPISRFVVNQDTGGAIKGPGRVDLFWGNGKLAEKSAGSMRSKGKIFFIIAKKKAIRDFIESQRSD